MKKYRMMIVALLAALLAGCAIDNMDEPASHVHGRIVYQGQPLGVRSTGGAVKLEIWQGQFGAEAAMDVYVAQDGTFSAMIYDGPCRLVAKDGVGPWENRHDTIYFDMKGSIELDYPVTPYFTISDEHYSLAPDSVLTATFRVNRVSDEAVMQACGLIVNRTRFVDMTSSDGSVAGQVDAQGVVTAKFDLKQLMREQKFLFARVYVKIRDVEEALYSVESYQVK
ncbi:MAG: DUF3823 domain-containing protein [Muribaculaceae bacterium]|nr:DUF3823 domain-containing protein [Muribaculaceae bacterium]